MRKTLTAATAATAALLLAVAPTATANPNPEPTPYTFTLNVENLPDPLLLENIINEQHGTTTFEYHGPAHLDSGVIANPTVTNTPLYQRLITEINAAGGSAQWVYDDFTKNGYHLTSDTSIWDEHDNFVTEFNQQWLVSPNGTVRYVEDIGTPGNYIRTTSTTTINFDESFTYDGTNFILTLPRYETEQYKQQIPETHYTSSVTYTLFNNHYGPPEVFHPKGLTGEVFGAPSSPALTPHKTGNLTLRFQAFIDKVINPTPTPTPAPTPTPEQEPEPDQGLLIPAQSLTRENPQPKAKPQEVEAPPAKPVKAKPTVTG